MYKKLYFILIDLLLICWCFSLVSILFASGTDGQEYVSTSPTPVNGYAIIENTDAAIYSIDTGQSVNMVAPTIVNTTHVGGFSAILNNVKTFSASFFLQNGLGFDLGGTANGGWVVFTTDTYYGLGAIPYINTAYYSTHTYRFLIFADTIDGTTGNGWYLCVQNVTLNSSLECEHEPNAPGISMKGGRNTSIFAENGSNDPTWYNRLNGQFKLSNAKIYLNNIAYSWSAQHRHTQHRCGLPASSTYPAIYNPTTNTGAIEGSLANGGNAKIRKKGVPLHC